MRLAVLQNGQLQISLHLRHNNKSKSIKASHVSFPLSLFSSHSGWPPQNACNVSAYELLSINNKNISFRIGISLSSPSIRPFILNDWMRKNKRSENKRQAICIGLLHSPVVNQLELSKSRWWFGLSRQNSAVYLSKSPV